MDFKKFYEEILTSMENKKQKEFYDENSKYKDDWTEGINDSIKQINKIKHVNAKTIQQEYDKIKFNLNHLIVKDNGISKGKFAPARYRAYNNAIYTCLSIVHGTYNSWRAKERKTNGS